jgi:hypothetical protein
MEHSPLYRSGSYGPPWLPLTRWVAERNAGVVVPWARTGLPIQFALPQSFGGPSPGSAWSLEEGRIIRRDQALSGRATWHIVNGVAVRRDPDTSVLGGFGPDGWRDGPEGVRGERFENPWIVGSFWDRPPTKKDGGAMTLVLADSALRSAFFIRSEMPTAAESGGAAPTGPAKITVSRTPLGGEGDVRPLQAYEGVQGTIAVGVGPEIVVLGVEGGVLGRVRTEAGEAALASFGGAWPMAYRAPDGKPPVAVATLPEPVRVIGAHARFRIFGATGDPVVADAVLEPVNGGEHAIAWLRRSVAILRPPVLSLASFLAPAPANYEAMFSAWLLDPLYGGGNEVATLVLCLGLGAVCAVAARRRARIHRPAPRDVLLWTAAGALLGPVGLAWMRLVVPREAVRACGCGAHRAVSVETCGGCGTPWPAPARTGVEVMHAA